MTFVLVAVIVVLLAVIGWLLRPGPSGRRGGTLDLVPAAARGELDLDWSDPRSTSPRQPAVIVGDDGSFACVGSSGRFSSVAEGGIRFDVDQQAGGWLTVPLHGDAKSPVLLTASPSG